MSFGIILLLLLTKVQRHLKYSYFISYVLSCFLCFIFLKVERADGNTPVNTYFYC